MYNWHKMSEEQREYVLRLRKLRQAPWHSPPHRKSAKTRYLLTASCYEHKHIIGSSPERMADFEKDLVALSHEKAEALFAWVVMPNHYHILLKTDNCQTLLKSFHQLHGRTSFHWNGEDKMRGRKVWFNVLEKPIKSDRHFHAALNYVHHNPVKHSYVEKWTQWPYSSSANYLKQKGREKVLAEWREYDISEMGEKWDEF